MRSHAKYRDIVKVEKLFLMVLHMALLTIPFYLQFDELWWSKVVHTSEKDHIPD